MAWHPKTSFVDRSVIEKVNTSRGKRKLSERRPGLKLDATNETQTYADREPCQLLSVIITVSCRKLVNCFCSRSFVWILATRSGQPMRVLYEYTPCSIGCNRQVNSSGELRLLLVESTHCRATVWAVPPSGFIWVQVNAAARMYSLRASVWVVTPSGFIWVQVNAAARMYSLRAFIWVATPLGSIWQLRSWTWTRLLECTHWELSFK